MNPFLVEIIEARAAKCRAAGLSYPSVDEFKILYGEQPSFYNLDDYLSTFPTTTQENSQ